MVWTDSPSWITCWNDSQYYIQALQNPSIECIVALHPWLENDCLMADIILPVSTKFEEDDIGADTGSGQFESGPSRESVHRTPGRIDERLRDRGQDRREARSARGVHLWPDQSKNHQARLRSLSAVPKSMSWEEFNEKHYFVVPPDPDWEKHASRPVGFDKDPESHPL